MLTVKRYGARPQREAQKAKMYPPHTGSLAMAKLTRKQIAETLESVPIETVLLGAIRPGARALTHKQVKFAEAIARGETKAGAYRAAYKTQGKPETQSHAGTRLLQDSRIAAQVKAFQVAAEARRYATPAALRGLVIEQLTAMAVNEDMPPAQRLRALELLGKVTEVAAFTERREVVKVTDAGSARDRLLEALRSAVRSSSTIIDADQVLEIRSEPDALEATGDGASDEAESTGGAPPPPESAGLRPQPLA